MQMKTKTLAVAAGLCAGISAMAQTSVTLYGIVDVSVRSQTGLTSTYVRSPLNTTVVASGVGFLADGDQVRVVGQAAQ